MPEDLLQSLIQSMTLNIGGVECSHTDNFGESYRLLAAGSCPKHVYDHGWAANMGAYKYRQCKRMNMYCGADHDGTDLLRNDATNEPIIGQVYDHTSHPMFEEDNEYYTTWADGKKGKWVSIPLAELLFFFKTNVLVPTPFLGSIDLTINWAEFNKACLVTTGYLRDATGVVTVNGAAAVTPANSRYDIEDLTISCDMVDLDRTYVSLLSGLVSSSPQGIVLPYEDMATSVRSFQNSGQNSIYISKGKFNALAPMQMAC
jgi:hypothetical protein